MKAEAKELDGIQCWDERAVDLEGNLLTLCSQLSKILTSSPFEIGRYSSITSCYSYQKFIWDYIKYDSVHIFILVQPR